MTINNLYISTVDYVWKSSTTLLNNENLDQIIKDTLLIDCHTSVEDLSSNNITVVFKHAKTISLVDIDEDVALSNNNCFSYGRLFNELIKKNYTAPNFSNTLSKSHLTRPNNEPVLWTAGCSVTQGVGVMSIDRWGSKLANLLEMKEIPLAKAGTSIFYSADQLLRSDLMSGDIVVWGLTNIPRIEVSKNWNFVPLTITSYTKLPKNQQYWNLDYFDSETQTLQSIRYILQVINFCKKINVKLYLCNLLDIAWISVALKDYKNFVDLTKDLKIKNNILEFIDLGSDGSHPGPKQHSYYVEKIYNLIKEDK